MSILNTPIWTVAHIAIKFPAAVLAAGLAYFVVDHETKPIVAITFDDGRQSVLDVALPYLSEKGMVATTYLNTSSFGYDSYIGVNDVKLFADAGWEIGSHGVYHDDMTTISPERLQENLDSSRRVLSSLSYQNVTSFASPYGAFNDFTVSEIQKMYSNHVNAVNGWNENHGMNYAENFDSYNINRIDIVAETTSAQVCERVNSLPDNTLYVILFHELSDVEGKYNTPPKKFKEIVDCIYNSHVRVMGITDATQEMVGK